MCSLKPLLPTLGSHVLCFNMKKMCLFPCSISFSWEKKSVCCGPAEWKSCLLFMNWCCFPSTVLPWGFLQHTLTPHPGLYFSSPPTPASFFCQDTVSKARLWPNSWQRGAATCTSRFPPNGRKFSTHKRKAVWGVGSVQFCLYLCTFSYTLMNVLLSETQLFCKEWESSMVKESLVSMRSVKLKHCKWRDWS